MLTFLVIIFLYLVVGFICAIIVSRCTGMSATNKGDSVVILASFLAWPAVIVIGVAWCIANAIVFIEKRM